MAHGGVRGAPYEAAHVLASWAVANRSYVRGQIARSTGITDWLSAPATLLFDLIYCLLLEETDRRVERREDVDEQLASFGSSSGGKPDRATWGRLPQHQRAMRSAIEAGERA